MLSNRPINEELSRLKEGINFWILEHSKLHSLLTTCHTELIAARQKILALEHQTGQDAQVITDLRRRLAQDTQPTKIMKFKTAPAEQDIRVSNEPLTVATPSSTKTPSTTKPLVKAPTIEEYSNALHLTLATRKELRDQKKGDKVLGRREPL